MNNFQLFTHKIFRFIWNAVFVISYPVLATFGLLFVGITISFSKLSSYLARFSTSTFNEDEQKSWEPVIADSDIIEAKVHKQIIFGPNCYQFRRKDGIPSILEEHVFGKRVKLISQGLLMEKWNTTDINEIPDFDICLYRPDEDQLTKLTNIKCFDWHLADHKEDFLYLKWFDGIQGGEVKVAIA
ncbi:hypothetical protein [Pleomorphovibrio marinus]|uniref:hypothetical protein n=1 Tax=Pleomorphovibrio marinus TaxID=2164132 RepID=UPI000E0C32D6|nr:hypothetical protein [Pleomorphovibrio marinus]